MQYCVALKFKQENFLKKWIFGRHFSNCAQINVMFKKHHIKKKTKKKCLQRESNSRPLVYKTSALTPELWRLLVKLTLIRILP